MITVKGDTPKDFKQGDFVKIFVQVRTSVDDNGKEYSNVRILSFKLLKAKEQMKSKEEKKESVLGVIKKYQAKDKENLWRRKKQIKKLRDKFMVGVVFGLHRLFFSCASSIKENIFMKKVYFVV